MLTEYRRNNLQETVYKTLYFLLRLSVGLVFLWAGFTKLLDPKSFGQLISQYRILPEILLPVVAVGLPLIEVMAGAGLIFDRRYCLGLITVMTLMFLAILWFGILNDLEIDCGCFSTSEQIYHDSLRTAFKRDWILLSALIYLYYHRLRFKKAYIF